MRHFFSKRFPHRERPRWSAIESVDFNTTIENFSNEKRVAHCDGFACVRLVNSTIRKLGTPYNIQRRFFSSTRRPKLRRNFVAGLNVTQFTTPLFQPTLKAGIFSRGLQRPRANYLAWRDGSCELEIIYVRTLYGGTWPAAVTISLFYYTKVPEIEKKIVGKSVRRAFNATELHASRDCNVQMIVFVILNFVDAIELFESLVWNRFGSSSLYFWMTIRCIVPL